MNDKSVRLEFSRLLSEIQLGMHEENVRQLLGNPDVIVTDSPEYLWKYGCHGAKQVLTLGAVRFRRNHVVHVYGGVAPSRTANIEERDIRDGLLTLSKLPELSPDQFHPAELLRVATELSAFDFEQCAFLIEEFCRVTPDIQSDRKCGILLLSMISDVKAASQIAPWFLGALSIPAPVQPDTAICRFPITILQGIPFCLIEMFTCTFSFDIKILLRQVEQLTNRLGVEHMRPSDSPFLVFDDLSNLLHSTTSWNLDHRQKNALQRILLKQLFKMMCDQAATLQLNINSADMTIALGNVKAWLSRRSTTWEATQFCYSFADKG